MVTGAGQQVIAGRYELTAPISTGGMGQVWRGYDTVLDRDIAVKLIRPDLARDDDTRAELLSRFRREARVTAKIEHSGVPAVHDAAFDAGADRLYLVMQLVRGIGLDDVLAQRLTRPIEWAVSIAAQLCAALSYAHAVPVVHRDLKPGNIMIATDGAVKILDFGVAAVLRSDVTHLTATGSVVGTKPYMSPEQINNTKVSPRSDLYAVGCLLHELLCGQRVFDAADEVALMYQHLEQHPQPLRQLRDDIPEQIALLVLELLAKQPEDRPANASEVYERLAPFLPSVQPPTAQEHPGLSDPTRPYRRPAAPRPSHGKPAENSGGHERATQAEIDAAFDRADALIEANRPSQAAEVLAEVIPQVSDEQQELELRRVRAAALFLGGNFQRALPEFERLAVTYARIAGTNDEGTLECRSQAAYCREELGDLAEALAEQRAVLAGYRERGELRTPEVIELRRAIVRLQIAGGHQQQAVDALPTLYADAREALGDEDTLTAELSEMLTRLALR